MVSVDKLLKIKARYPEDNQMTFVSFFFFFSVVLRHRSDRDYVLHRSDRDRDLTG